MPAQTPVAGYEKAALDKLCVPPACRPNQL